MTTRCNARCPMCPCGGPQSQIPQAELSLGDVERILPEDFVRQLDCLYMCGNFGDAITARDTLDVFRYLRRTNPGIKLKLVTNGGGRDAAWWRELARVVDRCTFGIDGLEDTNHLYRRGVDWSRVMASVEAYVSAGGVADWDFLVFRHNEHQVEQARALSRRLGFSRFNVRRTARFGPDGRQDVFDESGRFEYALELPREERWHNPMLAAPQDEDGPIFCKVLHPPEVYVSAQGHVFPCCFAAQLYGEPNRLSGQWRLVEDLPGGLADLDGRALPIREIIDGPFFQSIVPATWKAEGAGASPICRHSCGPSDAVRTEVLVASELARKAVERLKAWLEL